MNLGSRIGIQALSSLIAFLLLISSLAEPDVKLAVQFTLLLSFQNFTQLLIRRMSYESYLYTTSKSDRPPLYEISLLFFSISAIYAFMNSWSLTPVILVSIYAFLMSALDFLNFTVSKKSGRVIISLLSICVIVVISLFELFKSATVTFIGLNLILFLGLVFTRFRLYILEFRFNKQPSVDWIRGADYFLSSGYAFFLPVLVLHLTSELGLIELRSSQIVLSVANFLVMAFYLSDLNSKFTFPRFYFVFSPSILIVTVTFILFQGFDSSLPLVGLPLTHDSILLILLLSITLVFSQSSLIHQIKLVKDGKQHLVLKRHFLTFPIVFLLYFLGISGLGVIGFGLASIFAYFLEYVSMRQIVGQNDK